MMDDNKIIIKEEDLVGTYEQRRAAVSHLNLIDDIFFSVVMEQDAAAEYLLTRLLNQEIKVVENKTQYSIRNIEEHSIILDAFVEDENHELFDVEVQTVDEGNLPRRMRYYHTAIDWSSLSKNKDYNKLPELYMIFISKFDPYQLGRNFYPVNMKVGNTGLPYDDGIHRLYFNTEADDGSEIAKLMKYIAHSDAPNNNFGALSQQVNYLKIRNEGVDIMCDIMRDSMKVYAEKLVLEGELRGERRGEIKGERRGELKSKVDTVNNMLDKGFDFKVALECTCIDEKTYFDEMNRRKGLMPQ